MGNVYITDYISDPSIELSILGSNLISYPDETVEVLMVWHQKIDAEYISKFPRLKGVVRYGAGYDNLDLNILKVNGIVACNTPDYGTDEVSDTALAMILNISRGVLRYNEISRHLSDGTWQENVIQSLRRSSDITIGIVGAGRIGTVLMQKLSVIGFKVAFFDPYKGDGFEKTIRGSLRMDSLEMLLGLSDIVSIHVPLNDETRGMVNSDFLNAMKPGSSLVNTARGHLIEDMNLLLAAMRNSKIDCLALDVLPEEPLGDNEFARAWRNNEDWIRGRLIVNPHTAYYSIQSFHEMRSKAALNALKIIRGEKPKYQLFLT